MIRTIETIIKKDFKVKSMNILFITLADIKSVYSHDIYSDLIREFAKKNHNVYVASPVERRNGGKTGIISNHRTDYLNNVHILKIRTGNIQKTNFIEKGISTLFLEVQLKNGIKKFLSKIEFDLVLYSTPPVTIVAPIKYIKQKDNAKTYLLLKDITPQAIVDLGAMKKTGIMGIIYRFFRKKEKQLYGISDNIGCMSQANVDYIISNNPQINPEKVEICPNSIEIIDKSASEEERIRIRKKYSIPLNKRVFIYGGNIGKPQGICFIVECLKSQANNKDDYFLIVGDGTEFDRLSTSIKQLKQDNIKLMRRLPKDDYDTMVGACDIGMIFLDYRFTVPNFPSRLLSYMQAKLPILACTDLASDVGKVIVEGNFGWWCNSNDVSSFEQLMDEISSSKLDQMKCNSWEFLKNHYSVDYGYQIIMKHWI